jgi:hypothetical protein
MVNALPRFFCLLGPALPGLARLPYGPAFILPSALFRNALIAKYGGPVNSHRCANCPVRPRFSPIAGRNPRNRWGRKLLGTEVSE